MMISLDTSSIQECIRGQFPEVGCSTVRFLSQGCDFRTVEVDGRWVFRFPKEDEADRSLLKEFALLGEVRENAPLPIPRYRFRGQATERFPRRFGGYEKIAGEPGMRVHPPQAALGEMARDLGRFLSWLHSFDADRMVSIGLDQTVAQKRQAGARDWAMTVMAALGRTLNLPPAVRKGCEDFFADTSRVPPEYDGPARLLHCDYDADHVLLDPATGRVTGIVDWGDACVGDPAWDFARIWAWQGDDFVEAMLQEYAHPIDQTFWDRVRYPCVYLGIANILHGSESGQGEYIKHGLKCLRRIFGEQIVPDMGKAEK